MEENAVLNSLGLFGLTRQEASIYLCLYQNGELTGYEAAKQTGISRSNVYSALSGLTDKGAAYLAEGNVNRYTAVPVLEFCENKIRSMEKEKEALVRNMPAVREAAEGYLTISGPENIRNKIIHMLCHAGKRIYFSASVSLMNDLEQELKEALQKEIKLVLMPDGEISNRQLREGSICYIGKDKGKQVRLIIDSAYALTGELTGNAGDTCLYTGQENFINVFKEALRNEIKLIQLTGGKENE